MKKQIISVSLVLAFILTALAGCGGLVSFAGSSDPPKASDTEDNENEQLLSRGYYEVYDEDSKLVGYLQVTGSKIVVYDEYGSKGNTLRYDYDAKKELYTLKDGELFGCEEFTVEKSRKTLILIMEDDDEYTLEEIDKADMPSGGDEAPSGNPSASEHIVERALPIGCYALYDDGFLAYYLKVTDNTMISYHVGGEIDGEVSYSYSENGHYVLFDEDGDTITAQITYKQGSYYFSTEDVFYRLEPVSEDDIIRYDPNGGSNTYYIGSNGSIGLHAWLPYSLYDALDFDYEAGGFIAQAECYDDSIGADLRFYAVAASGDFLREGVNEARLDYDGAYSSDADLLYRYLRDSFVASGLGDDFRGGISEDYITINGRDWRGCEAYTYTNTDDFVLLFWMEGDDMVLVMVGGTVEDSGSYDDWSNTITAIIYSLKLDT